MSRQDLVNVAIANMLASYSASAAENVETVVVRNAPKAEKSSKGTKAAPIASEKVDGSSNVKSNLPGPKSEPLPKGGTIDANTFIKSLSSCGKRPNANGVPVFQGETVKREDEMRLIASYIGWDSRQLHGAQLENARRTAQQTLKPIKGGEFKRGSNNTLAGYISGLPDHQQKLVQDLLAREQVAAEALAAATASHANMLPGDKRDMMALEMQKETERLSHIRKDLAKLGAI